MGNNNPVIEITSLGQYIEEVKGNCLQEKKTAFPKVYFRGEAKKEWKTEASLFRGKIKDIFSSKEVDSYYENVNYSNESDLIASALIQCPQAFEKCTDAISRLILMQHYGLPTRLYDVTANPLVALYFACNIESKIDGKVLFTKSENNLWSSHYVNYLAELNEEIYDDEYELTFSRLLHFINRKGIMSMSSKEAFQLWLFRNVTKSFLFQPPFNNDRIKQQKGAMIFSSLLKVSETETRERYEELAFQNHVSQEMLEFRFQKDNVNLKDMFSSKTFIIEADNKKKILQELDMLGINEGFVYPEIEHQFRTIKFQNLPKKEFDIIINDAQATNKQA